ncbi:MAG TPA: acyl-CoA dehydrogenase family protein [Polyangiales bacterium]
MDFSFNEEQNLLRDSVRKFVEKSYSFEQRRALSKSELGFSRDNWRAFAELGWTAIPFCEADGGLGGKAVDTMIVVEELGKGLVLEPYFATVVFAGGLLRRGGDALRAKHLPGLIGGETLAAVAYAEVDSRFDLHNVATTAKREGSGFVLDGKKIGVIAGPSADLLIVSARTSGGGQDKSGITLFAVDAKSAGVSRKDYRTVDGLRASDVTLSKVKVDASSVIGEVDAIDNGLAILEAGVDEAIIALGAEAMGVMEVLFKSTLDYIKERKQFGVPIGSFQALQHRMVDVFIEYEQAKSMAYMAAMTQDAANSSSELAKAAAALKVQLGKSGRVVGQQAIQLHGGMGMTEELAVSHYFKRMTIIDLMFGNADHHLGRYVALSA